MQQDKASAAMTKRAVRTIKAELEFLYDSDLLTQQQLTSIISQLPSENNTRAPAAAASVETLTNSVAQASVQDNNNNYQGYYAPPPTTQPAPSPAPQAQPSYQQPPPPAYPTAPAPPLAHATAMYVYNGTDAGDLNLMVNDRVAVTEYMNAEWWKGRCERTGQEGIFPRSYVRVEEKNMPGNSYGNVPLAVSQAPVTTPGGSSGAPSKYGDAGKKMGKKVGNAALFGAGATIGSNIVNSIF